MKDVKTITGKLDMDSNPLYVTSEDYSYARNFRNNNKNDGGKHGNVLGLESKYTGDGDDVVIGSVFDTKRDSMILFVYNTDPDENKILLVDDQSLGTSGFVDTVLFKGDVLNFSEDERITPKVVDDSLIWTDSNGVRLINIPAALRTSTYTDNYTYSIRDWYDFTSKTVNDRVVYEGKVYRLDTASPSTLPDGADYTYLYDYEFAYLQDVFEDYSEADISFVALPPLQAPIPEHDTDYKYVQNNIYGKQFKFAYRFEYFDGRQSVWSPWSDVSIPYGEDTTTGLEQNPKSRNVINLKIDFGKLNRRRLVSKVYIASWEQNDTAIKIIDELKVYNDDYTFAEYNGDILISDFKYESFYNNEIYVSEALSDFLKSYHYVPQLAESITVIDDNRVLLGNTTDGFDLPQPNVNIDVNSEDVDVLNTNSSGSILSSMEEYVYITGGASATSRFYEIPSYQRGYSLSVTAFAQFSTYSGSFTFTYTYQHDPNKTDAENLEAMIDEFSSKFREESLFALFGTRNLLYPPSFYASIDEANFDRNNPIYLAQGKDDGNLIISHNANKIDSVLVGSITDLDNKIYISHQNTFTSLTNPAVTTTFNTSISALSYAPDVSKYKSLQAASSYDLGVVYYDDALRSSGVVKLGKVKTPVIDYGTVNASGGYFQKLSLEATIDHTPPSNATKYSFVITENSGISDYIWMCLDAIATTDGSFVDIDIRTPILDIVENQSTKSILQDWVFQKGDRVKIIATPNSATVYDYNYEETLDKEILEQDDNSGVIKISHNADIAARTILMVYRPRKSIDEDNNVYREIGEMMDITGGYHISNGLSGSQDQTSSLPAIIPIDYGDTSIRLRYRDSSNIFIVEDKNMSDFYESDFTDLGRPQFYLPDMMYKNDTTRLVFGGKILPNSNINNISDFEYEDSDVLSTEFGSINGLATKGFTLLVIQDTRVTSYYINKDLITKADGTSELVAQSRVLNNKRVSDYDYGCVNPESIVQKNNHVYFFDAINGCFVRHADNGAFPISDYGVNTFAKDVAEKQNLADENDREFWVHGGIDEFNNEVVWAVVWDNETSGAADLETESISFDTLKNQWRSFWDYKFDNGFVYLVPNGFSYFRNKLCCYIGSYVYFTESDTEYMPLTIEVIGNQEPLQNKVFNYIGLESNEEMNNDSYDAVNVDNIMKTNIPVLKQKEGNWYAEFRRDSLTPMAGTQLDKARGGRRLRGKWIKVRLSTDVSTDVNINGIIIDSTISNRL
jgi:hypothetical protein